MNNVRFNSRPSWHWQDDDCLRVDLLSSTDGDESAGLCGIKYRRGQYGGADRENGFEGDACGPSCANAAIHLRTMLRSQIEEDDLL
jgi:hypothetical protein